MNWSWVYVTRPKTLVASFFPVLTGGLSIDLFSNLKALLSFFLCMLFALLVQIGTNMSNDYYDALRGTDCNRSNAPSRMVAKGILSSCQVYKISICCLFSAFVVGCFTLVISGATLWFIPFGLLCIFLAYAYTGGAFPISYNGLGDIFVILFFGFGAVEGTRIIVSSTLNTLWEPHWFLALGLGLIINNLLVVNNYRDYEGDKLANKKTTVVIFGKGFGLSLYLTSTILSSLLFPLFTEVPLICMSSSLPSLYGLYRLRIASNKSDFSICLKLAASSVILYGTAFSLHFFFTNFSH